MLSSGAEARRKARLMSDLKVRPLNDENEPSAAACSGQAEACPDVRKSPHAQPRLGTPPHPWAAMRGESAHAKSAMGHPKVYIRTLGNEASHGYLMR